MPYSGVKELASQCSRLPLSGDFTQVCLVELCIIISLMLHIVGSWAIVLYYALLHGIIVCKAVLLNAEGLNTLFQGVF